MRQALAFVRVSTGSQDESTQVTTLQRYAAEHDITIADTVRLHGYSASAGEQEPAIRDAIRGITLGRWSVILVTDSSRLDRRENLDAQAEILLAIRQAGGDVVSTTEPNFGQTDFAGRIVTLVAQYGNAEKSRTVKDGTWRGVQAIIANKAWSGALPPFWSTTGERYRKQAVCTDPEAVRDIYRAVRNGESLSSLARKYGTYPQSIRTLVRTEANRTGVFQCHYTYAGQTYKWEHTVEPTVDDELWHSANRAMGKRGAVMDNRGGRPVTEARSWISGIIPCPNCDGHLYVLRGKSLRCSGKGKQRISCGVSGIPLDRVTREIESVISDENTEIYRFQRVSGNQGELDSLKAELDRVRQTLATTDDRGEFERLSSRRWELQDTIDSFQLVRDSYEMSPTGETLADLWRTGDRRTILKALQRYLGFNVGYGPGKPWHGAVWVEGYYPSDTLIEITSDTCIRSDSLKARIASLRTTLESLKSIEND